MALRRTFQAVRPMAHARAFSSTDAAKAKKKSRVLPVDQQSFMRRLFVGDLAGKQIVPFPKVLNEESQELLGAMVDPVEKFMEGLPSAEIDLKHEIPKEVLAQAAELGLWGLQIPEEYGGMGLNNTEYSRIVEELCFDASLAVTLMAHQSIGLKGILLVGNEEQKSKYLPKLASGEHIAAFCLTEPTAGSDAQGIRTKAELSEDGKHFVINGSKMWISNGGIADVFTVFARTGDKMTAFVVEKEFGGVIPGPPESKLGIRGSNTVQLTFEDCKVPVENVLGEVDGGFKVAMMILNNGRFGLGAGTGGGIKKMIKQISQYAQDRTQFGSPLSSYGLIQQKFSTMATQAYAIESMVYACTALIDDQGLDASVEAAACKIFGSEAMFTSINECIQIMGGLGFAAGEHAPPYERLMRDSRILLIFEGTNEILRLYVGLTCLQGAGAELSDAMKNPMGSAPSLIQKTLAAKLGVGAESLSGISPELSEEAKEHGQLVAAFGGAVRDALSTYKKDIINQQRVVARIADISIDLYAIATSLSRASSAEDASRAAEMELARSVHHDACVRIKGNLDALAAGPEKNGDALSISIAERIFANGGEYQAKHPLGV